MNNIYKTFKILIISAVLILSGCARSYYQYDTGERAKNVILIIGDGMGLAHIYSAMTLYDGTMNLEKAKKIGFVKTHSSDNYSTDSAAAGTAMATGTKTRNGMIGLAPDTTMLENLTEYLHKHGLVTGVVSSSSVTHATPASFASHNINRNNYYEIASDFVETQPDVFIGGGRKYFDSRQDGRDLIKELRKKRYDVVFELEDLLEVNSTKLAGLLAPDHLPTISEGRGDMLAYGTLKAIETLSKDRDGFFLMVEGSQIDWAAHDHNTRYVIEETIDLDRTLGVALDYARRLGETLVLVTADHETGGMTLPTGDFEKGSLTADYSVGGHTGIAVPIFAFGPGSDLFTGFMDNTEIHEKILRVLSLDEETVSQADGID